MRDVRSCFRSAPECCTSAAGSEPLQAHSCGSGQEALRRRQATEQGGRVVFLVSDAAGASAALEKFAATLEVEKLRRAGQIRFGLPLIFESLEQETNFFALSHLLAFGSAWHQVGSRSAPRAALRAL